MDVFWICLTAVLITCAGCVTFLLKVLAEEDNFRLERECRRLRERAEKAEKAEADSRQAITGLLSENKRLLTIIKKKGYEKED